MASKDKASKTKGKKERKTLTKEEKAAKAAKYDVANENFRKINETKTGKITTTTSVAHIRGKGCLVREVSDTGSVSLVFIPGVKVKKKKEWLSLVEDKGPKPKKEKKDKKKKS